MKKTIFIFILILSLVLVACDNTDVDDDNTNVTEHISILNTEYQLFEDALNFINEHEYFNTVYYDEDVVIFVYNNTLYEYYSDGTNKIVESQIGNYDRILYYDKDLNQIYYADNTGNIDLFDINSTETENPVFSSYDILFNNGGASFGGHTYIWQYPNNTQTYEYYNLAYSKYNYNIGGYDFAIYSNHGSVCDIRFFHNSEEINQVTLSSICTEIIGYDEDYLLVEMPVEIDTNVFEYHIVYINRDGTIKELDIDYTYYDEYIYYDEGYIVIEYYENPNMTFPYRENYTADGLNYLNYSDISNLENFIVESEYIYGYSNDIYYQIRVSDSEILKQIDYSDTPLGTTDLMYMPIVHDIGDDYFIIYKDVYKDKLANIYSNDGELLDSNIYFYSYLNNNKIVYLKEESNGFNLYLLDLDTKISTLIQDKTYNLEPGIVTTEYEFGVFNSNSLDTNFINKITIDYFDLDGKFIETYTRLSHSKYLCLINEDGEVFFINK